MKKISRQFWAVLLTFSLLLSGTGIFPALVSADEIGSNDVTSIGKPSFKNSGSLEELYQTGVEYTAGSMLKQIYDSDVQNIKDSTSDYYMDRILARPGEAGGSQNSNGNDDGDALMTRGRALYMYTHNPSVIGFGGDGAYTQSMGKGSLYSVTFQSSGLKIKSKEDTSKRVSCPSYWTSSYSIGSGLTAEVSKFISEENVAVTLIDLTNTSAETKNIQMNVSSDYVSQRDQADVNNHSQDELVGSLSSPSGLTTLTPRLTGDELEFSEESASTLIRDLSLSAGDSVQLKVVMSFTTKEIPESTTDYLEFAGMENQELLRTQKKVYNQWWYENIPYINVPNKAMQKAIDYRWWLERFNQLDANIPGYDYQYPTTIEGVLGYNNAIVLTQPMHLQDVKWMRSAYLPYGMLLSLGNSSQSSAFLDNPGNRNNWNNHYGQYIATAGLEAFNVKGGSKELADTLAYYFEHDAKGQLEHYGNHSSSSTSSKYLTSYRSAYMTGNDADTISFQYPRKGTWVAHAENAYVYGAADAVSKLYSLTGNAEKAGELSKLAENIQSDILTYLWSDKNQTFESRAMDPRSGFDNDGDDSTLIPWKENNNFNYFSEKVVPTDETSLSKYSKQLTALKDKNQYPIWPCFTANQVDNTAAVAAGASPSNNFSNINFTVQARAYEAALHTYDRENQYVTPEMLELLLEWAAYNLYPDAGDVTYPNNNEFYNIDNKDMTNYYRSWISHDTLGNYNYLFIEDMAGLRPRSDDVIELDPVDLGYDHFMVNNLSYHGKDLTLVWDKPNDGKRYFDDLPEGYSLYIDGKLVLQLDQLAGAAYHSDTGEVTLSDSSSANILLNEASDTEVPEACDVAATDSKVIRELETSGIVQDDNGNVLENLAEGASVTASYTPEKAREASWADKHRADGTDSTSTAVNEMAPDPQAVTDGMTVNMPFWGNDQSENDSDSLVLDLKQDKTFDMMNLYFYNDRQSGGYTEPARYNLEYWDAGSSSWKYMDNQTRTPNSPWANYNNVKFDGVTSSKVRVTFFNKEDHYTAVTEIQLYQEGGARPEVLNQQPQVSVSVDTSKTANLSASLNAVCEDDGMPYDQSLTYQWSVVSKPEGAETHFSAANSLATSLIASQEGVYTVRFTADDGEYSSSADVDVTVAKADETDIATQATPASDYTASWEDISKVNDTSNTPSTSSPGTANGWGNWGCPGGTGSTHYLEYDWPTAVNIYKNDIYWYDDGGGTRIPSSFSFQYLDEDDQWQDVSLKTDIQTARQINQYNTVEMEPIRTKALRMNMVLSASGTGVLRWKVYSVPVSVKEVLPVYVATKTNVQPKLPSTMNVKLEDDSITQLPVKWDSISDSQLASSGQFEISGLDESTKTFAKAVVYVRSDMDKAMITDIDNTVATTDMGKKPVLPETVKVQYNNGAIDNVTNTVVWSKLSDLVLYSAGRHLLTGWGSLKNSTAKATLDLTVNDGNKTILQDLYTACLAISQGKSSGKVWQIFQSAIQQAESLLQNKNPTQKELNDAISELVQSREGLSEGTSVNKQALQSLYDTHKNRRQGNYTDRSWSAFITALQNAESVLNQADASQAQVNAAVQTLRQAVQGLTAKSTSSNSSHNSSSETSATKSGQTEAVAPQQGNEHFRSDTTNDYHFAGGNNSYIFKISTSDTIVPSCTSSDASVVQVVYAGKTDGGYLFRIISTGEGKALITTKAGDGTQISFAAYGNASAALKSDTPAQFKMKKGDLYQFKFTSTDGRVPTFTAGNFGIISTVSSVRDQNDYYIKVRANGQGSTGIYASFPGQSPVRQCVIQVGG